MTANLIVGLNPYGLTWTLGLQGVGTPRANPAPGGLEGFLAIAGRVGARVIDLHEPWLEGLGEAEVAALGDRLRGMGVEPVLSSGLPLGTAERAIGSARALGARTVRLFLTFTLCGDRALRPDWEAEAAGVRAELCRLALLAEAAGVGLAIENHQDFGSAELMAMCEAAGPAVGICLDTGNAFPVAEAPLAFARAVAPRVRHVHLKDYRVRFTDEGMLLCRCAIGDGAVPMREVLDVLLAEGRPLTASLEPAALDARHVRLLTPGWWRGYAPRDARALAECLEAARRNRIEDGQDHRTPWERGAPGAEVGAYEVAMVERSAAAMRAAGIMQ